MRQDARKLEGKQQNERQLRTSSPIVKGILTARLSELCLAEGASSSVSGIHVKPEDNEGQRNIDANAAAIIADAHLAIQSYSEEGNYRGLASTYCLLAEAEDSSSFDCAWSRAEYYRLAGRTLRKKITRDRGEGAHLIDILDDDASARAFFSKAGDFYILASMRIDELDTITRLFSNAAEMYLQVSDYPAAYGAAANAAEYESDPRVKEVLSSVSDVLGGLSKGDGISLDRLAVSLVTSAEELAERELRYAEAAHMFAVLAQIETEDANKIELLKKATLNYARAGDSRAAVECHCQAANIAAEDDSPAPASVRERLSKAS